MFILLVAFVNCNEKDQRNMPGKRSFILSDFSCLYYRLVTPVSRLKPFGMRNGVGKCESSILSKVTILHS